MLPPAVLKDVNTSKERNYHIKNTPNTAMKKIIFVRQTVKCQMSQKVNFISCAVCIRCIPFRVFQIGW